MASLKDLDTEEHVNLLTLVVRAGPIVLFGLLGVEFLVWGPRFLLWFLIPDIAFTALVIWGLTWLLHWLSQAASTVYLGRGSGNEMSRQFSEQEALVIAGRYVEAADSYRAIVAENPRDNEARLRLASLLERECHDPAGAEACYLTVRESRPTARQDWTASNGLIDLYQRERKVPELRRELARLASRHRDSEVGAAALRRLKELDANGLVVRAD